MIQITHMSMNESAFVFFFCVFSLIFRFDSMQYAPLSIVQHNAFECYHSLLLLPSIFLFCIRFAALYEGYFSTYCIKYIFIELIVPALKKTFIFDVDSLGWLVFIQIFYLDLFHLLTSNAASMRAVEDYLDRWNQACDIFTLGQLTFTKKSYI